MAPFNNPAGRLCSLLEGFNDAQRGSIAEVWAQILEVQIEMVRERLGSVAELVTQIDVVLQGPELSAYEKTFARHRADYLETIFPLTHGFNQAADGLKPSKMALEDLAALSTHLSAVAPEPVASEEDRARLLEELQALIAEITDDTDLPTEIAHLIVRRLSEVEAALRHIDIGGPDAVRLATEALMGAAESVSVTNEKARESTSLSRVIATAGIIWSIFTFPASVQPSIEAWEGYARQLSAGPAHVAPAVLHQAEVAGDAEEVVDAEVLMDVGDEAAAYREGSGSP